MKKVALLGGSFNPIHLRHVSLAQDILDTKKIDEVWFLVSYNHRYKKNSTSFKDRCEMVRIAIRGRKGMKLCIEESNFSGITYTADVVKYLQEKYPYKFYWVVGTDLLKGIKMWYKKEELFSLVEFVVIKRKGFNYIKIPKFRKYLFLNENISGFSSTKVRNKIIKGDSLNEFIDFKVYNYIKKRNLYKNEI